MSEIKKLTEEECSFIINEIQSFFEKYNIKPHKDSTIAKLIKHVKWLKENNNTGQVINNITQYKEAAEHIIQARDFAYTFHCLSQSSIDVPIDKVRILTKDCDILKGQAKTQPNDIFFELMIAARIKNRVPACDIDFDEPDIIMKYADKKIAICCKRPNSENNIKNSIKDGINQGNKAKNPFLITIDTLELFRKYKNDNVFLIAENQEHLLEQCNSFLDLFLEKKQIQNALSPNIDSYCGGIILCLRGFGCVKVPPSICYCLACKKIPFIETGAGEYINTIVEILTS